MAVQQRDRVIEFNNLIYSASKSLHRLKSMGMKAYDLGSTHTFCLRALSLNTAKHGLTRTELAKACAVDKAQISRIVSDLVEMGYVLEASKGKGYRKKIVLTERGAVAARDMDDKITQILDFVSGDIPDDEIEGMYTTLYQICERLKRAETECPSTWSNGGQT